jgi:hypothetical protein
MPMIFNSRDWYWFVGDDTSRVYSSKRNIYVNPDDGDLAAWSERMGMPPYSVGDESEIWYYTKDHMPAWLWDGSTMSQPGVDQYTPMQLQNYAQQVHEQVAGGGMVANGVPIKTDVFHRARLSNARTAAEADNKYTTTILGSDNTLYPLNASQIIGVSGAAITFGTHLADTYAEVHAAAEDGSLTSPGEIDDAFSAVSRKVKDEIDQPSEGKR